MDTLQSRLHGIIAEYWRIPKREGNLLLHLLLQSRAGRAVIVREHLRAAQPIYRNGQEAVQKLFHEVLTPAFMVSLTEDFVVLKRLSRVQANHIQECMLRATDSAGRWKAV